MTQEQYDETWDRIAYAADSGNEAAKEAMEMIIHLEHVIAALRQAYGR